MKKLNLLLMMFASLSLVVLSSCKKDEPTPQKEDISISVSGGTSVEVKDVDISKDITITASEKAKSDIVVMIKSDASALGDVKIEPTQVTIKAGETTAQGKVTFVAAKFPKGTKEKKIVVTISSPTEGVKIGVGTTDFLVKGDGGEGMATLVINANGTEFNTTTEAQELSVVFTLSEELTEKLAVTITVDPSSSDVFKTMFPLIPAIEIPANQKTFTIPFTMPKGTDGVLKINFAIATDKVKLETTTLSAKFINNATPSKFSLVRTTTGDIAVPNSGDKEDTFNVTLDKASDTEQTINLTVTDGATINPASVTFAVGEKSKSVKVTFLSSVFSSPTVSKDVTVTGISGTLEAIDAKITYKVKGIKKQELYYYIMSESGNKLVFSSKEQTKTLKLYVTTDVDTQEGAINLKVDVTGVDKADYVLPNNGIITSDSEFMRFEIVVNKSAAGKTLVVTISSDDTTIEPEGGSLSFPVVLVPAPETPSDYKVDYTIDNNKTIEISSGGYVKLIFKTKDAVVPSGLLLLTPVITGDLEVYGLDGLIEMDKASKELWISVTNFNDLAKGATGTITFTSDYTTFADGAGITLTIKK